MINYKVILFNGPPRSGKDTGVEHAVETIGIQHMKLAGVLKERTHALYGLIGKPTEWYDRCKDRPHDDFLGISPRDAYINVAEKLFKAVHGETIFPELLTKEIRKQSNQYVGVSDLGFDVELKYFVEQFGSKNVLLVKIYRDGCTFDNDSRDYVDELDPNGQPLYPGLQTVNIINEDLDKYKQEVQSHLEAFLAIKSAKEQRA